jgi:O-antigen ligase
MISYLKKTFKKDRLRFFELLFLALMLFGLPSFEAPKNIFLVFFLGTACYRQFKSYLKEWCLWDSIFLLYIASCFLSFIFAGINPRNGWGAFQGMLLWISFGWVVSKNDYTARESVFFIIVAILSVLPPLIWGLLELSVYSSKKALQLHSVGHVNHSAIFLTIVFGASIGVYLLSNIKSKFQVIKLHTIPIIFFVSILITESRAATLTAIITLSFLTFSYSIKRDLKKIIFYIYSFIIFISFLTGMPIISKQIESQKNKDLLSGRSQLWNTAIDASFINPILGIGNENWQYIKLEDIKRSREKRGLPFNKESYSLEKKHAHSIYLSSLLERGWLGLLSLVTLMIAWFILLLKDYRNLVYLNNNLKIIWGASTSAFLATFIIGSVNSTFHHEHAILALFFLGLHLASKNNSNK